MTRLERIEKMLEAGSADPFVWYARAMELKSLERLDDALGAFGEVKARFADYLPTYLMAGQVAAALGRVDDARSWLLTGKDVASRQGETHALSEIESALAALPQG